MIKYNFNAGPSMLPREVVEQTAAAVLDYDGMGLSLMPCEPPCPGVWSSTSSPSLK